MADAKPNDDIIAAILSEEGVANASYLAVKIAETFDPSPHRGQRLEAALQKIATGEIAGEPANHRDTLSIVRSIAREALDLPSQDREA
jgi:hypothetical protein